MPGIQSSYHKRHIHSSALQSSHNAVCPLNTTSVARLWVPVRRVGGSHPGMPSVPPHPARRRYAPNAGGGKWPGPNAPQVPFDPVPIEGMHPLLLSREWDHNPKHMEGERIRRGTKVRERVRGKEQLHQEQSKRRVRGKEQLHQFEYDARRVCH